MQLIQSLRRPLDIMKPLYLSLLIILYLVPTALPADPIDKVAELMRQGNTAEISKLFATSVEITMYNEENVYSKIQAALILDKFFSQNKPKSVKILHKVNSNPNYQFGVLLLNTENGNFRVTYTLKQTDGNLMLIEIHMETEKAK